MATPIFSKSMSIVIDGSVVACPTDFSLSITKDMVEVACITASGAKQNIPDLYSWTASFSGTRNQTATVGTSLDYDGLVDSLTGSDASVGIYYLPDVSSNNYVVGWGYLSSITMDGGVGSPVSYSAEITGSSVLTKTTTS